MRAHAFTASLLCVAASFEQREKARGGSLCQVLSDDRCVCNTGEELGGRPEKHIKVALERQSLWPDTVQVTLRVIGSIGLMAKQGPRLCGGRGREAKTSYTQRTAPSARLCSNGL